MDQFNQQQVKPYKSPLKSIGSFVAINLGIATLLMLIFCPSCFLSWRGIQDLLPQFFFSFMISMILSFGGGQVEDFYEKRISWIHKPVKRLILTVSTYMAYSFVASFLFVFVYTYLDGQFELSAIPWKDIANFTTSPMWIALVFMAIFTTASWLREWRKSAIEAEQLKSERLAFQYQSLKDQLNPHFLFNSLNVLSGLVYEDADRSAAFIQKLSKIYRYVLDVQQEDLVSLKRELDFAKNYLELQKIRFENNLQFFIPESSEDTFWIPPLSLQLLLENAVKHNVASEESPLVIHIEKKEDELWIRNSFQPKSSYSEGSAGVGLANIVQRYELLHHRLPIVHRREKEFIVQLPLVKMV
ncbi:sensor histidine kinase [Algoriphagus sp.]|uniref:sensor histidine kinase n=1 Tax=Algoriphagus sp. TaxID=1872435 RepID=UPI00262C3FAD|nr:sensor histidine kinase [Algoriphagus sp.]